VGTEALSGERRNWFGRTVEFLRLVNQEIKKITWPTWTELRKATVVILIFVAILGVAIGWMDWLFQQLLVVFVARSF